MDILGCLELDTAQIQALFISDTLLEWFVDEEIAADHIDTKGYQTIFGKRWNLPGFINQIKYIDKLSKKYVNGVCTKMIKDDKLYGSRINNVLVCKDKYSTMDYVFTNNGNGHFMLKYKKLCRKSPLSELDLSGVEAIYYDGDKKYLFISGVVVYKGIYYRDCDIDTTSNVFNITDSQPLEKIIKIIPELATTNELKLQRIDSLPKVPTISVFDCLTNIRIIEEVFDKIEHHYFYDIKY